MTFTLANLTLYSTLSSTILAVFPNESILTDTTKTFAGESSLTSAIVQTWTAAAGILLEESKNS